MTEQMPKHPDPREFDPIEVARQHAQNFEPSKVAFEKTWLGMHQPNTDAGNIAQAASDTADYFEARPAEATPLTSSRFVEERTMQEQIDKSYGVSGSDSKGSIPSSQEEAERLAKAPLKELLDEWAVANVRGDRNASHLIKQEVTRRSYKNVPEDDPKYNDATKRDKKLAAANKRLLAAEDAVIRRADKLGQDVNRVGGLSDEDILEAYKDKSFLQELSGPELNELLERKNHIEEARAAVDKAQNDEPNKDENPDDSSRSPSEQDEDDDDSFQGLFEDDDDEVKEEEETQPDDQPTQPQPAPTPQPQPQPPKPDVDPTRLPIGSEGWQAIDPNQIDAYLRANGVTPFPTITYFDGRGRRSTAVFAPSSGVRPVEVGGYRGPQYDKAYRKFEAQQEVLYSRDADYVTRVEQLMEDPEQRTRGLTAEQQAWSEIYGNNVYATRLHALQEAAPRRGLGRLIGDQVRRVTNGLTPEERQAFEEIFGEEFDSDVIPILQGKNLTGQEGKEQSVLAKQYFGTSYRDTVRKIIEGNPGFRFQVYGDESSGKLSPQEYATRINYEVERRDSGFDPQSQKTTEQGYRANQAYRNEANNRVVAAARDVLNGLVGEFRTRAGESPTDYFNRVVDRIRYGLDLGYIGIVGRNEGRYPTRNTPAEQRREYNRVMAALRAYDEYLAEQPRR